MFSSKEYKTQTIYILHIVERLKNTIFLIPAEIKKMFLPELCIHLSICKIYVILLLTLILMNVQSGKGFRFLYEDHLEN